MWKTLTTRYFIPPIGSSPIIWGVVMSIVLALPSLTYPLTGRTYFIQSRGKRLMGESFLTWEDGAPAFAGMFFYIFVGLTFHFSYFWREKPALEKFSPILSNISVIAWFSLAIICAFL